jgi:hypothetical protein
MMTYNPATAPDPSEWLQLDEQERILRVEDYHRLHGVDLPSLTIHCAMHVIVENQLAEARRSANDAATPSESPSANEAVLRALARLVKQGLTRHDAVHAIAAVVTEHIFDLLKSKGKALSSNSRYYAQIERLDAAQWWKGGL